jgi:hypothetical protein
VISDADVEKLEADQRRSKNTPDNKRSEIIARITEMRDLERKLATVRDYVEQWEDSQDGRKILLVLEEEETPISLPEGQRPDRRKRRIMQLYHRWDTAVMRAKRVGMLVEEMAKYPGGDDDAEDIKRILAGGRFVTQ